MIADLSTASLYRYVCCWRELRCVNVFPYACRAGSAAGDDIKKVRWLLCEHAYQLNALGLLFLMALSLATEVRMIKGVGPQRAELLASRGIYTLEDLLTYLPFRYEDRIHFSKIQDIQPNGTYTIRARVMSGQAIRSMRGRDAIYHLLVQDESGSLPCKF